MVLLSLFFVSCGYNERSEANESMNRMKESTKEGVVFCFFSFYSLHSRFPLSSIVMKRNKEEANKQHGKDTTI